MPTQRSVENGMRSKENPPPQRPVLWEAPYAVNYVFHLQEKKLWLVASSNSYVKDFSSWISDIQHEKQITQGNTREKCLIGLRVGKVCISVNKLGKHRPNHQRIHGERVEGGRKPQTLETRSWPTVLQRFGYTADFKGKGLWTRIWKVKSQMKSTSLQKTSSWIKQNKTKLV